MLSVQEIQDINVSMLGLGAPVEKDGEGYNKPDFARMEAIGMLDVTLTMEECYVVLQTLQKYVNTQLQAYKPELQQTYQAYEQKFREKYEDAYGEISVMGEGAKRKAIDGEKHQKGDYKKRELIFYGMKDDCAVMGFQKGDYISSESLNIKIYGGRWMKAGNGENAKWAVKIPLRELEDFMDCVADKGKYGYEPPAELVQIIQEYNEQKALMQPEITEEPKYTLTPTGEQNNYGYDLYELNRNEYSFNQQLWALKGKGLSYVDYKTDKEKVIISTNDRMLPRLLKFCREQNIDVSPVENAPVIDRNASGNTLIDVSTLKLPFKPFDFQIEDAQTVVGRKKALLGHDMGCGKTFISALVGMSIEGKKLVICPETLRLNWKKELQQTAGVNQGADIRVVYANDKNPQFGDWTIMGYITAKKFAGIIMEENIQCMFVDEAHKCKAVNNYGKPDSKQAATVISLSQQIKYTYLLTGTPMPTRNKDLFNQFVMLGEINPNAPYAFSRFGNEFCNGHSNGFGMDYNGSSNTDELHEKLAKYMVRRLKSDVLPNLTKQRIPIVIEGTLSKDYRDIEKRLHKMEKGDTYMALAMTGRRHLSQCKVNAAIEFADTILEGDESVVLVAEFNETLDKMMEYYGDDACCIRGGMSDSAKQQAIDDFQSGRKKVCCINLIAAGVGITLTKAHNMVVCDFDWTPANMTQVEDRICRTGQGEHCNIFYICHEKAILDDIFLDMITNKSENIDKVVDNAENTVDLNGMRRGVVVEDEKAAGALEFIARLKARIEADNEESGDKPKRRRKAAPKGVQDDGDATGSSPSPVPSGTPEVQMRYSVEIIEGDSKRTCYQTNDRSDAIALADCENDGLWRDGGLGDVRYAVRDTETGEDVPLPFEPDWKANQEERGIVADIAG